MIVHEQNIILQSRHGKSFLADVYYQPDKLPKPIVIFSHGFKGFKDWGTFHLVAEHFASKGFVFVKFNFSHNGTTVDHPLEFADLEAFGNNNMSIEMDDLGVVIDWVTSSAFILDDIEADKTKILLLGHSRGGGITILKAGEDNRVKKIAVWGSVNEYGKYWKHDEMDRIKKEGVIFVPNTRTGQQMPVYWQLYENYFANLQRLYIPDVVKQISIPFLIIHGTDDETIPYSNAIDMHSWNKHSELFLIEHGNHNFGGKHPWTSGKMPEDLEDACDATIEFYKR